MNMHTTIAANTDWQLTRGAAALITTMIAASEASIALGEAMPDGTERTAQSTFGKLETRLTRVTENSNSREWRTSANGGIVGEIWMTLEQMRGDFLVSQVAGGTLNTHAQCTAYSELCEAALTVEAAVLAAIAGGAGA